MGFVVSGLFFFRFWRQSRDRLFLIFAMAFLVMAVERVILARTAPQAEYYAYVYLVRLAAFVLIILAIIDKNRARVSRS